MMIKDFMMKPYFISEKLLLESRQESFYSTRMWRHSSASVHFPRWNPQTFRQNKPKTISLDVDKTSGFVKKPETISLDVEKTSGFVENLHIRSFKTDYAENTFRHNLGIDLGFLRKLQVS